MHERRSRADVAARRRELAEADTAPIDEWPVNPAYAPPLFEPGLASRPSPVAAPPRPRRSVGAAALVLAGLLVLLLGLALLWALSRPQRAGGGEPPAAAAAGATHSVPGLVGTSLASARRQLQGLGLGVQVRHAPSRKPSGTVLAQAPAAGSKLAAGADVVLVVAASESRSLPSLVGLDVTQARTMLAQAGLESRVRSVDSNRPRGVVIRTQPDRLARVHGDTVVTLFVSVGGVAVPRLVGLDESAALDALAARGLRAETVTRTSSKPNGVVIGQRPASDARAPRGASVRIEISRHEAAAPTTTSTAGPRSTKVLMPHVTGLPLATARRRLQALGLRSTAETVASTQSAGTVLAQSPVAGAQLRRGMTVQLRVAATPTGIAVPAVVGLDESSARDQLARAGFQVETTDQTVSDPSQDGVVLAVSPPAGRKLQRGATVTLTVGRLDSTPPPSG